MRDRIVPRVVSTVLSNTRRLPETVVARVQGGTFFFFILSGTDKIINVYSD